MTLSGATTAGQSGPGSYSNEGILYCPQSSSITGTLPSDYLVSYLGHSLGVRLNRDAVDVFYWSAVVLVGSDYKNIIKVFIINSETPFSFGKWGSEVLNDWKRVYWRISMVRCFMYLSEPEINL